MEKGMKKFKKISSILLIITAVLYTFVNIFIYKSGQDFAKEHGATKIVVDYHYVDVTDAGPQSKYPPRMSPSFFYFYDINELGNQYDVVVVKALAKEYEKMNLLNDGLFEGLKLFVTVVGLISFGGGCYAIFKRTHSSGFFIGSFFAVSIFFGLGMLNYLGYVVVLGLGLSIVLISRARFIDYNQSRIPFIKKKKYN